jgi:hypothetical protein
MRPQMVMPATLGIVATTATVTTVTIKKKEEGQVHLGFVSNTQPFMMILFAAF